MYKKTFVIIFLIFSIQQIAKSQKDTVVNKHPRLVYYIDETNYPGFLIPFIETYLKDLTYSEKDLQSVYSEVISLNMLFEKRKIEGKIIDAFIFADRRKTILENSQERDTRDKQIANSLLNYDKFLIIKIRPFNSLLEYQFLMYDVTKNKQEDLKDSPVLSGYRSSSIFIDPQSAKYKEELVVAIKQVYPEVNEPPKAQININSKSISLSADTIFLPVKDTIYLTAIAIDPDSPKERFTYTWTVNENSLYGQFQYGKEKQKLVIDIPMVFNVGLTIGDGINQSKKKDIVLAVINRPEIDVRVAGNAFFLNGISETDLFNNDLVEIQDNIKRSENYSCDYIFRKDIFGQYLFLDGNDSLTIHITKGDLRLGNTNVTDSILPTMLNVNEVQTNTTDSLVPDSNKTVLRAGKYTNIRFYPGKILRPAQYHYSFYANYKGVKSRNLNIDINFIKARQLSIVNEYCFVWLGPKKGGVGLAFLGVSWQLFSFIQLTIAAAYPMYFSYKARHNSGDKIQAGGIHTRMIVELFNPSQAGTVFSLQMHRFPITTISGENRCDNIWGIGLRTNIPFLSWGSKISPIISYNYFPNLTKRSYISGLGMFEVTIGLRYNFLKRE